jgi:hypothetical protein
LRQFFSGMSPILDNANNEKKCPVSGMRWSVVSSSVHW